MERDPVENPSDPPAPEPVFETQPEAPLPPLASRVRFCRQCGTPQDSTWTECLACAQRLAHAAPSATSVSAHEIDDDEGRPVTSALALYFVFLATSLVGIIVLNTTEDPELVAPVELTIALLDVVIVLIWVARSWRDVAPGLKRTPGPLWYLGGFAAAFGTFLVASAVVDAVSTLGELPIIFYAEPLLAAGYGWTGVILLTCLQPAVIEELAFRGVMLSGLQRVMAARDAVIVSSTLFMIIHLSPLSFPHLLLIGLVLGWMRVRSGSLYPGMVLHFVHNGLVLVAEQHPGLVPWS